METTPWPDGAADRPVPGAGGVAMVGSAVCALAVVGVVVAAVPLRTGWTWINLSGLTATVLAVAALVDRGVRLRGGARSWRLLMGASLALVAAAVVLRQWYPGLTLPGSDVLCADVLQLATPLFQVPAVLAVPTLPAGGRTVRLVDASGRWHRSALMDMLIVVGALAYMVWDGLLQRAFTTPGHGADRDLFLAGYGATLGVIVLVVVVGVFREPREPRAWALLVAGLAAMNVTGAVVGLVYLTGTVRIPAPWLLGYPVGETIVLFAAFATATRTAARSARAGRISVWAHAFLPYPFIFAVGVDLLVQELTGEGLDTFDLACGSILLLLVCTRQLLSITDNTRLVLEVEAGHHELHQQAFHDSLTGLANRALFRDRLEHAVALHHRELRPLAVLFLDLDGFKGVNDRLGHNVGDQLLRSVARRLSAATRASDTVARLGGDEFAVLLEGDQVDPAELGRRLVDALQRPYTIDGIACTTGASVGLAVAPATAPVLAPYLDADTLLQQADVAMYAAKARGKGTLVQYRPDLRGADGELEIRTGLALALAGDPAGGQLAVAYQPIVSLTDGTCHAVEALARWTHPTRGAVPPHLFIPTAEDAGLIGALDSRILERACQDVAALRAAGAHAPAVHVNVSATRVGDDTFPLAVETALRRHGLPPEALIVEITETGLIPDLAGAATALDRLADQGIRIALDDIGVGRTAIAALYQLPIHELKLDRSLIIDVRPRTRALRTALVTLAHSLDMTVVAEGIETAAHRDAARDAGADLGQGYWFARPGPLHPTDADLVPTTT